MGKRERKRRGSRTQASCQSETHCEPICNALSRTGQRSVRSAYGLAVVDLLSEVAQQLQGSMAIVSSYEHTSLQICNKLIEAFPHRSLCCAKRVNPSTSTDFYRQKRSSTIFHTPTDQSIMTLSLPCSLPRSQAVSSVQPSRGARPS
jgi:hypothetical protein